MVGNEKVVAKTEEVLAGEADPLDEAQPGSRDVLEELFGDAQVGEGEGPVEESTGEAEHQDSAARRAAPDPGQPSQSEIDDHNIDHWPYRSWCEHCVAGRAIGEPHVPGPASQIPVVAFDYLFITRGRILKKAELSEDDKQNVKLKILVVKDTKSRAIFAHAVRQKGVDDEGYAVARVTEDIQWLGYTKVILKTDGERAIVRLLKESLKSIKTTLADQVDQASFENPPTYDPRSNGSVENAVKLVKGMLRSCKSGLEARINGKIPDDHPVMTWLVEHVAWILTIRPNSEDGKTPFQRVRGRPFLKRAVEFGERIMYKLPTSGPRHDERGELQARWVKGFMVGYTRFSNEYLIWNGTTVVKSRAIQRMKRDLRWHREGLEKVTVDVHGKQPVAEAQVQFEEQGDRVQGEPVEQQASRAPQTIAIRQADWLKHGGTPGCSKCIHATDFGWGQKTGPHSAACVTRFKRLLTETEEGQRRVREADERQGQWMARKIQDSVENPPAVPPAVPREFEPFRGAGGDHREPDGAPKQGPGLGREDEALPDDQEMTEDAGMDAPDDDDLASPTSPAPVDMDEDGSYLEPLAAVVTEDVHEDLMAFNEDILKLINEFGGSTRAYRRERRRALKAIVAEIYSPPRVTQCAKMLPGYQLAPGFALDLTEKNQRGEAWDFDDDEKQDEALALIDEVKPLFLVGSPMCTAFSTWQRLCAHRRDPQAVQEQLDRAIKHMRFVCKVYKRQIDEGRYFLHEHPAAASSWKLPCIQQVMNEEGVDTIVMDQCQLGQKAEDGSPIRKPTKWMSNSQEVLKTLSRRCQGRGGECSLGGVHKICEGSRARRAAIYPFALCRAILKGFRNQMRKDGMLAPGIFGLLPEGIFDDGHEPKLWWSEETADAEEDVDIFGMEHEKVFKDAITGQILDPILVREARKKELEYFESKEVWFKRPKSEAYAKMGKPPISVKWVDVNKGDDIQPNYRSRLVAREIRRPGEDSIFAPTPPLESLRTVISMATTDFDGDVKHVRHGNSEDRTQISIIDISRAYFNAKKDENVNPTYVELPHEDPDRQKGQVGLLRVHMYGTRAAADGWHGEHSRVLEGLGFSRGDASACVFRNAARKLVTSVHGDDFSTAGPKKQLDRLKRELERKYELKENYRIGPGANDAKEGRVLNRIIRWTSTGVEYEADPRQGEKLILDLGLEGAKSVGTPGVKLTKESLAVEKELEECKHTAFRGVAARGNYLAADRPDVQYATKEICRWMAQPTTSGVNALKRLGRYLEGHRRLIMDFPFQRADTVDTYSDTDWSGCIKTRKSTSGGCLMIGKHLIKSWSSTQGPISLSSGEAEFYGVVKASGVALGYQALLRDLGLRLPLRVWTDSSATMGICSRQGLGKLRHIDTRSLWVQQRVRDGSIELRKVRGEVNPADLFTKHLPGEDKVKGLLQLFGCRFAGGRALEAPELRRPGGQVQASVLACDQVYELEGDMMVHDGYEYPVALIEGPDGSMERVPDAYLHDVRQLPHEIPGDINVLFPKAHAADALQECPEEPDSLEARGEAIGKDVGEQFMHEGVGNENDVNMMGHFTN